MLFTAGLRMSRREKKRRKGEKDAFPLPLQYEVEAHEQEGAEGSISGPTNPYSLRRLGFGGNAKGHHGR